MDPVVDAARELLAVRVNAWMASCLGIGVLAIVVGFVLHARICALDEGSEPIRKAGRAIHLGVRGFLGTHVTALACAALAGSVVMLVVFQRTGDGWTNALAFFVGCAGSALAGLLATRTADAGGARAAHAASTRGLCAALRTAYLSGAAGGLFTIGFGVVSVTGLYLGTGDPHRIVAFALGASVAALFGRVGGGILAKSADVGLSLAIRADQEIPDDSASNPGVIADDVGDLAGDVTGMGADLFESFAASVVASMALGAGAFAMKAGRPDLQAAVKGLAAEDATLVLFPVAIFATGIVAALLAALFVKTENERKVGAALQRSVMVGALLLAAGAAALTVALGLAEPKVTQALTASGRQAAESWRYNGPFGVLLAVLAGLVLGIVLGRIAEWNTSEGRPPARGRLARQLRHLRPCARVDLAEVERSNWRRAHLRSACAAFRAHREVSLRRAHPARSARRTESPFQERL